MGCTDASDSALPSPLPVLLSSHDTVSLSETLTSYSEDGITKEKASISVQYVDSVKASELDFPDGGLRAWLVVVGVVLNLFSTSGFAATWGVFQSYYQEVLLPHVSPSSLAWIGSIQYALMFMMAILTGRLFDLGYFHSVCLPASILQVAATFLIAECKQYWHFLLCQGIVLGIDFGCTFSFTAPILAHWFNKRRELVMGFWAVGAALGGTILPICARFLISSVGFKWTMRSFGSMFILTLGLSNLLMRRRLPPKKVTGGLVNVQALRSIPYATFCLSAFVIFLGLYTPLTFIAVSARSIGISRESALYFVTFANAGSLVGRLFAGFASGQIGTWKVIIPSTVILSATVYAWPFVQTEALLVVFTVLYGFTIGVYIAMMNNPVVAMGDTADVGRRVGMFFTVVALGSLAGPPISGALTARAQDFTTVGAFAGSCILVSAALMGTSRYYLQRDSKSTQKC